MRQAYGLDQVGVRTQGEGDALGNLRHFEGVGETGAEEVSLVDPKHLGFPLQPAKGRGVDNARPVALELRATVDRNPSGLGGVTNRFCHASRFHHEELLARRIDSRLSGRKSPGRSLAESVVATSVAPAS